MEMDQEKAQELFKEGAVLVFLDVPEGTEFGIDYNSWTVGSQFKGVKMIPPGIHFVYYSASNKYGETSPRTGFFYNFKKKETLLKTWDKINEEMKDYEGNDTEKTALCNREEMDRYLGAYPYDNYKTWVSLSNHITPELVDRIQPENGKIVSVSDFISEKSTSKSRKESPQKGQHIHDEVPTSMKEAQEMLPEMVTRPGTKIRFSEIPKVGYPPGSSPQQITKYSMDSTYKLNTMIENVHAGNSGNILGELQFSFICFLIGQVYDAFEQWKKLVRLLCSCEEAVCKQTQLYLNFIQVMHFQVREIPEDFFVDIVSQNNFLTSTLQEFFMNIQGRDVDKTLKRRGLKFKEHLTNKFKWDFSADPEDWEPVFVDTL